MTSAGWRIGLAVPLCLAMSCSRGEILRTRHPAPAIDARTLDGAATISLDPQAGKVLLVDFWASWCAICRQSLPRIEQMREDFDGQGFEVIGVDVDQDPRKGLQLLESIRTGYSQIRDPDGLIATEYGVEAMPSSYLIDRKGFVRKIYRGFNDEDLADLRQTIVNLLEEK